MAIWKTNGTGTAVPPVSGNTYECLSNGIAIGSNLNETRLRSPVAGGFVTFPGDSLTLDTNTEIRMKTVGSVLNFPGVGGNPGLILKGGMLNVGDSGGFVVTGVVQVASQSYLCPGDNDANAVSPNRYINITGQLTGGGSLVLFEGGTSNPMQISGNSNTFSGQWIVKCSYLQGAGINSLGTNSITVDPNYVLASPPFDVSITSAQAGPAVFEVNYDLNSAGVLTLTNGGQMKLHQNCAFSAVKIEGTSLSAGTHSYSELNGSYPANFPAGGSGSITVQAYNAKPQIATQPTNQTVNAGQTAQFTVGATGLPLFYQWKAGATGSGTYTNLTDGGQISGSATTTLTLTSVTLSNAADYLVIVTNLFGAATSSVATLTVTQAPPSIVTQPVSQMLYTGQTAQFTVSVGGTPLLHYQWRAGVTNSGVYTNLTDGGQISGSATTNLTITTLTLGNAADYLVVVTNAVGSVTSSVATLTVLQSPPPATNALESALLRLEVDVVPFSFRVIEKSTATVLLSQTANKFTFGGTYSVYYATNFALTPTTLDADLILSGTSSTGHITFNFIQPGIIQTTLSSSNNASNIFQQFADQGEDMFGALETPFGATLSARGYSWQLKGGNGVSGIDQACGAHAPFYLTTRHYGIYAATPANGTMTFAQNGCTSFSFPVSQLTYDIIYGADYATIMAGYNSLAGSSYMPPTWAFDSIWWKDDDHSSFPPGVTNAQGNVLDTANQLIINKIHAASEWIDRPYGTSCGQGDGGWGNMDFDTSNTGFNNPAQMVSDLHARGINLMLWIADLCWCNLYNEALTNGYLFYTNNNSTVNLQNTNAYNWFKTNLDVFVNLGVMGYKIDRGDQGEMPDSMQNLNDTLFEQLAWQGMAAVYPTNSFIFSRSVSDTGRQYSAVWNGDTYATFTGLQYSIIGGLRSGIINFPMWGSDTGGYITKPTEELFDRWFEFSAYSPIMEVVVGGGRTPWYNYSTNFSSPTNIVAIARAQAAAHHDLIPYTRSLLCQAIQTGMPVMRPIMFAYPNDPNVSLTITNCEYMFGPHILVAPVITAGATNRDVYLPAGNWLDYNAKSNLYVGPANITVPAPIQTIPLFVNAGAIIPRGDILQGNNLWTTNWSPQLRIEFFPSENSGNSFPYYTGSSVQTITCSNQNHALTIQFGDLALSGNLEIYAENPGNVIRNGTNLTFGTDYTYDPTNNLLRVPFSGATTLVVNDATSLFGTLAPFEAWRLARFGNTGNPTISGASSDPDGDGIPNFLEYAFGLNPLAASSNGLPFGSIRADSGTNYLALTFGRATNATDTTFTVMVASNLLSQWLTGSSYSGANVIPVTAYTTEISRVPSNGIETITVRDNVPIHSAPQQFMRLRVTKP
jgi:alpha-glucosidase (family GH31 glycosyl hydrolase)